MCQERGDDRGAPAPGLLDGDDPHHPRSFVDVADVAVLAGYRELGSDADVDNLVSHRAHAALGFTDLGRQVLFRKDL